LATDRRAVKAHVKGAIKAGTSVNVLGVELSLVAMDHSNHVDDTKATANAIRQALRSCDDEAVRARLCDKYGANGKTVKHFVSRAKAVAFTVKATQAGEEWVLAVAALRQLGESEISRTYEGTRQSPKGSKVAEIGMVYTDTDCQGMSFFTWTFDAVVQKARDWGMDELVLESTEHAFALYEYKGFKALAPQNAATNSTPMSMLL